MRRRVLIVVSSFAPAMIADMQRARQLCWELPKLGWDVEIIAPDESYQNPACLDGDSDAFFAPGVPVHRAQAFLPRLFRLVGAGTIGWRALLPMLAMGSRLLRSERFDLVYFSTTAFPLFLLGPMWKKRYCVPFVLDIHDPIYRRDIAHPVWARASVKHRLAQSIARLTERWSVMRADAIISVSNAYIAQLSERYSARKPDLQAASAVIPFAVLPDDFTIPQAGRTAGTIRYTGAGGPVMRRPFAILCDTLAHLRARDPALAKAARIELYGTHLGWKPGDARVLSDIAREHSVGDLVTEDPARVTYRNSVALLMEGGGCLILGVDDPGYMPSKLYPYAYSGKPLLAVVRKDGPAFAALRELGLSVHTIWFDADSEMPMQEAVDVLCAFLNEVAEKREFDRSGVLEQHGAGAMAREHALVFECAIRGPAICEAGGQFSGSGLSPVAKRR